MISTVPGGSAVSFENEIVLGESMGELGVKSWTNRQGREVQVSPGVW